MTFGELRIHMNSMNEIGDCDDMEIMVDFKNSGALFDPDYTDKIFCILLPKDSFCPINRKEYKENEEYETDAWVAEMTFIGPPAALSHAFSRDNPSLTPDQINENWEMLSFGSGDTRMRKWTREKGWHFLE